MSEAQVNAAFRDAVRLQRQGKRAESDALCSLVVQAEPRHFAALHLKGLLALERGDMAAGIDLIRRSLSINANQPEAYSNVGNALLAARRTDDALACFDQALHLKPDFANALFNRGLALAALGRARAALGCYERVLELRPHDARACAQRAATLCELGRVEEALAGCDALLAREPELAEGHKSRGVALMALARNDEALTSFEQAARLAPRDPDAHYGRGNALFRLGRSAEAIAAFDAALALKSEFPEALNNRSTVLRVLQRPAEALASCEEALRIEPRFAAAHFSRGNALQDLDRHREALESYDRALALRADYPDAHTNAGAALSELGEHERALARFDAALALDPRHVAALTNRGHTLSRLHRHAEAAEAFARLRELAPAHDAALGHLLNSRLQCCDWRDWSTHSAAVIEQVRAGKAVTRPLDFLAISGTASEQLECARIAAAARTATAPAPLWRGEHYGHERIRLAYVSGNFGQHPVWQLLKGVVQQHDAGRFEVTAISLGDDGSTFARHLQAAFPRFLDVRDHDDHEIARLLRDLEIDIAIDLQGFTEGLRAGVFERRPAPVQVNYLGYTGTLGAAHWDYIVADEVVIPQGEERWYAEQVVRLPHCYLPNDDQREIGPAATRVQQGLPPEGVVLCAFNNPSKINPPMFELWMRLLSGLPGSALWLRGWPAEAAANLRREAERRGVPGERLVFANPAPTAADHLGRLRLADLFLDTLPYNAHSTACEALWTGVPVLTCAGGSFASRVAASALRAVGMEELAAESLMDYERLALELGRDPGRLAALRAKLAANRTRAPLFDTVRYCRHLERAYVTMWERAERGERAQGFSVAPLPASLSEKPSAALRAEPRQRDALHELGILYLQTQRTEEGAERIRDSLRVDPAQPAAHMHLGIALRRLGRPAEAVASFAEALRLKPDLPEAFYNRANALADLGHLEEAVTDLERALELQPALVAALSRLSELLSLLCRFREAADRARQLVQLVPADAASAELLAFRGNALRDFGRAAEALPNFDRALELQPASADLWNARGIALRDLKRGPEALASFARALELRPGFAEALVNRGDALRDSGRLEQALGSYDQALRLKPALGEGHRGRGLCLRGLRRFSEALVEFDQAERLNASRLDLANQRGNALLDLGRFEEALHCYEQALALRPEQPDLLWNRGMALRWLQRDAEAMACFARLHEVAPGYDFGAGLLMHSRLELCDWVGCEEARERILQGLKTGARVAQPFSLLTLTDSAALQLECARSFAAANAEAPSLPPPSRYGHRRIRVAYVSGDLREHAVSYLMAGVFERHDRERFETIGLSLRPPEESAMGRRLGAAFDRFIDVSARSDTEVAALMRELEVDIAVDLVGYTEYRRRAVFAQRAAPVQVNYLGYPGTLGADFMDYILADEFVVPSQLAPCYTEKVVYLPGCFQANDDRRVAPAGPTRASVGLPESSLVFCCFNTSAKLTPAIFAIWCRLLQAVPESVLWLVPRSREAGANLRGEMARRGIDPQRLVFADMLLYPEHLARIALADLFLDTFPFSAGATASDALWAGVPLLSCVGEAFASRMAGSLLRSLGLAELVTTSLEDYERRALELAREPASLLALRHRLEENRRTSPVFDTTRFCRGLERAYLCMWQRAERGEPPEAFAVAGDPRV